MFRWLKIANISGCQLPSLIVLNTVISVTSQSRTCSYLHRFFPHGQKSKIKNTSWNVFHKKRGKLIYSSAKRNWKESSSIEKELNIFAIFTIKFDFYGSNWKPALFNQTERYFTTIMLYWNIFPPDFVQIIKDFSSEWLWSNILSKFP